MPLLETLRRGLARHLGQGRGGLSHPEEGDRQHVERLHVAQRGVGARGQEARQESVEQRGQLDDAAPDDDRPQRARRLPHVVRAPLAGGPQRPQQPPALRELHHQLQHPAEQGPVGHPDREARPLRVAAAEEHGGDLGHAPEDRRGVREEEAAVAVEDAEAPGGEGEHAGHREEDAHQMHRERLLVALETGHQGVREDRRRDHADDGDGDHRRREQPQRPAGERLRPWDLAPPEAARIDRNERGAQRPLAEQVLGDVRQPQRGAEGVGDPAVSEVVGEDALAHEPHQPREHDGRADDHGRTPRAGGAVPTRWYGGDFSGRRGHPGTGCTSRRRASERKALAARSA